MSGAQPEVEGILVHLHRDELLRLVAIAKAAQLANDYHQGLAAINRCELSKFDAALRAALSPEKERT